MASTETVSPRFADIEDWPTEELVDGIVEGQFAAIAAVRAARSEIAAAIEAAAARLARGGRLIYAGAGTSGRIAAQDAAELPPTFAWPYQRALAVMAGGETALTRSVEGAEDDTEAAERALADLAVGPDDVVVAVAASGRTPFAVAALDAAKRAGALAIGVFNNPGARLGAVADLGILLDTGAEFIAGSTRMKAGTAQKAALNALSTGIMVRLGYVYRGQMVEMAPSNAKLAQRAARMVAMLSGAEIETARQTLDLAGGSIKLATVMLAKGLDRAAAEATLAACGGHLREALR